ncbi:MAG: hypothetical protein WDN04_11030 [Rhodospirillales bacterium]
MAAQSIVDFVKQSLSDVPVTAPGPARTIPGSPSVAPLAASPSLASIANQAAELAYLTHASQVLSVLRDSDGLTARELFEQTKTQNYPAFELAIAEMVSRGLLRVVGRKPPFDDPIYSLTAGLAA